MSGDDELLVVHDNENDPVTDFKPLLENVRPVVPATLNLRHPGKADACDSP